MDLQKIMDTINEHARITRTDYHVTLGKMIDVLGPLPSNMIVRFDWNGESPKQEMSYRGYYSDLAFDWDVEPITVEEFAAMCGKALGAIYTGYKGGDWPMGSDTPLWASAYGTTGRAIIGVDVEDDVLMLLTKEID